MWSWAPPSAKALQLGETVPVPEHRDALERRDVPQEEDVVSEHLRDRHRQ